MKMLVRVYRSARREGMYLFVSMSDELARVPEALMEHFGRAEQAMSLLLVPERKLANASSVAVLEAIEAQGYYLQMPPGKRDEAVQAIIAANDKLPL